MNITKNENGEITHRGYTRSFCQSCIEDYRKLADEFNDGSEDEWEDTTDYQSLVEHWEHNLHEIEKMERYEVGLLKQINLDSNDCNIEVLNKCLPILSEYNISSQSDLDNLIIFLHRVI
jgi:hypothetical protein